jgi:hypothetical protein
MPVIQSTTRSFMPSSEGSTASTSGVHSSRARSAGIAQMYQSASTFVAPEALRTRAPVMEPPETSRASTACPIRNCTPIERRCVTHGSIQTSVVGPFSTRSSAPSLPRPRML